MTGFGVAAPGTPGAGRAKPGSVGGPGPRAIEFTMTGRQRRRSYADTIVRWLSLAATALLLIPLGAIILYVVLNGAPGLSIEFLTQPPAGFGSGGALQSILGTLQIVPLATLLAVPLGVFGGVYLSEFASPRAANLLRLAVDVLLGLPSIVVGVFVFVIVVVPTKSYNGFAAVIALAVIMVPIIMRSTEEVLRLVPRSLSDASLALGVSRWRTVVSIVLRSGLSGILTGIMLAVARAAGETAPLIMTSLGSRLVNVGDFGHRMDALPLFVYVNSGQPDPFLIQQAWSAALLLLAMVLTVNILVRWRTFGRRNI